MKRCKKKSKKILICFNTCKKNYIKINQNWQIFEKLMSIKKRKFKILAYNKICKNNIFKE